MPHSPFCSHLNPANESARGLRIDATMTLTKQLYYFATRHFSCLCYFIRYKSGPVCCQHSFSFQFFNLPATLLRRPNKPKIRWHRCYCSTSNLIFFVLKKKREKYTQQIFRREKQTRAHFQMQKHPSGE